MKNLAKVTLFSVLVTLFYTGFAMSIPQVSFQVAKTREISADMDPYELAAVGEQIVTDPNGLCKTCHAIHGAGGPGGRAPELDGAGARAETRVAGMNAEEYLRQSLLEPAAYVVEGFQAIMPPLGDKYTPQEIAAIIAFLQGEGSEITVQVPEGPAPTRAAAPGGAIGLMVDARYACATCHAIAGEPLVQGKLGPELTQIGVTAAQRIEDRKYTGKATSVEEYIRESVMQPGIYLAPECPVGPCPDAMPPDLAQKISPADLDTIVAYLAGLR
jgi:mono/diheme cytochrome c family protein